MNQSLRIAQLANFVGPASGGMKTAMTEIGRGYVEAGAARLMIQPGPTDSWESTDVGDVVTLRAPRVGSSYRLIIEPWRVIDVLEAFRPTSLEVSDKATMVPLARWAHRRRAGAVLFSHEHLSQMLSLRTGLKAPVSATIGVWNRVLARTFDTIVVTSRFAESEFAQVAKKAGTPLVRVPLGVDLETFRPDRGSPVDDGTIRLVHSGRLSPEKSPKLAVEAAVELHRRGYPVHMDVYGDGPQRAELEEVAQGAPVTFHGHQADRITLAERIASADIAISACPGETFGLSILEALACGTPVVTANVGGAAELITAESGAWGPPNPAGIADAVLAVLALDPQGRRLAARSRAEQYPWSATVKSLLDVHRAWARGRALHTA